MERFWFTLMTLVKALLKKIKKCTNIRMKIFKSDIITDLLKVLGCGVEAYVCPKQPLLRHLLSGCPVRAAD